VETGRKGSLGRVRTAIGKTAVAVQGRERGEAGPGGSSGVRGPREAAIARGIPAGEVAGRNAEEREAKARSLYPELFQALLEAEEALTRAKFRLEVAKARAQEVEVLAGLVR
jgi:hypothetical protein